MQCNFSKKKKKIHKNCCTRQQQNLKKKTKSTLGLILVMTFFQNSKFYSLSKTVKKENLLLENSHKNK